MILRILGFGFAALLLALGVINAANKAGLLGPQPQPTRIFAGRIALTLPAQWHLDQGEFAAIRNDVCALVPDAGRCAAYFIKGTGYPRAILALAIGPSTGPGDLKPLLARDGAEVSDAVSTPVPGVTGNRYRVVYKKRGRLGSLAVVDNLTLGTERLVLAAIAEEPEGRFQEKLLSEIIATLSTAPEPSSGR